MRTRRAPWPALMVLLLAVTAATTGCTPDDKAAATDFFFSWVSQAEGGQAAAFWAIATSNSSDPTIDAILKAKKVLEDIDKADRKAEEADKASDAGDYKTAEALLREAIKIRSQDWSYRNKLAALQMETGQPVDSLEGFDSSTFQAMSPKKRLAAINSGIYEYEAARERIRGWAPDKRGPDDSLMYEVDKKFVERLALGHRVRAEMYRDMGLQDEADAEDELADQYEAYKP